MRGTALLRLLVTLLFVSVGAWAMAAEQSQKPAEPQEPPFGGPHELPFGGPAEPPFGGTSVPAFSAPSIGPSYRGLAGAAPERRVALVVANESYADAPLQNPLVDAEIVRTALMQLGFDVTVLRNASFDAFVHGLYRFYEAADRADVALFYYAGHGFAVGGQNYLMSTTARVTSSYDEILRSGGLPLDGIVRDISNAARNTLVFVDACRRDPRLSRGLESGRSLAGYPDPGTRSVFVGLSTRAGFLAEDGPPGRGSPFARAFAKEMVVSGRRLDDSFRQMTADVMAETLRNQRPDAQDDLDRPLTLLPAEPQRHKVPNISPPGPEQTNVLGDEPPGSLRWGAIAYEDYSVSPGNAFGFATGATREEAEQAAIAECERKSDWKNSYFWYGCTVADREVEGYEPIVHDGCIALYSNGNGIWRYAKARTESEASRSARNACRKATQRIYPCKEERSFCVGNTAH